MLSYWLTEQRARGACQVGRCDQCPDWLPLETQKGEDRGEQPAHILGQLQGCSQRTVKPHLKSEIMAEPPFAACARARQPWV